MAEEVNKGEILLNISWDFSGVEVRPCSNFMVHATPSQEIVVSLGFVPPMIPTADSEKQAAAGKTFEVKGVPLAQVVMSPKTAAQLQLALDEQITRMLKRAENEREEDNAEE